MTLNVNIARGVFDCIAIKMSMSHQNTVYNHKLCLTASVERALSGMKSMQLYIIFVTTQRS